MSETIIPQRPEREGTLEVLRLRRGYMKSVREHRIKLMLSIGEEQYIQLAKIAQEKGLILQEMLRAIVIPFYLERKGDR